MSTSEPGDTSAIVDDERAQHLEYNQDWEGLAAHLTERLSNEPEHLEMLAPYLAEVLEDNLGSPERALIVVEHWLESAPESQHALEEAERLHAEAENWRGLVESYRTVISGTDKGAMQIAMLEKVAEVQTSVLNDASGAYETALNLLALSPQHSAAWALADQHHSAGDSWRRYVADLAKLAHQRKADAGPFMVRMAYILDHHLDEPESAIELYKRAVSLGGDASTALGALAELYAEDEAWDRAVGVYTTQLSLTSGADERVELLRKIAIVHDALNASTQAELAYTAVQALVPDDKEAMEALARLRGE